MRVLIELGADVNKTANDMTMTAMSTGDSQQTKLTPLDVLGQVRMFPMFAPAAAAAYDQLTSMIRAAGGRTYDEIKAQKGAGKAGEK